MEKEFMQQRVNTLMCERLVMFFDAKKFASWGVELLQDGYDSDNIRILAGLDYDDSEVVDTYFKLVADELDLRTDYSKDELLFNYSIDLAEKVLAGVAGAVNGVRLMCDIFMVSDYDSRYYVFVELNDALSSLEYNVYPHTWPGLTNGNKEEIIKREFENFLNTAK